jgi:Domain of unknown function (DUF4160)
VDQWPLQQRLSRRARATAPFRPATLIKAVDADRKVHSNTLEQKCQRCCDQAGLDSRENGEPPHIHVERGDSTRKHLLNPVALARLRGFRARDLTRLRAEIIDHRHDFLQAWNGRFGESA